MKTLRKLLSTLLAATLALTTLVGFSACGGRGDVSDPDAIQISVAKMGYGTDWLHNIANAYTAKTGNKVQITEEIGQDGNSKIAEQVESCASTIDISVTETAIAKNIYNGSVSAGGVTYDCLYADLTDVYTAQLDGENGATIESKMDEAYKNLSKYGDKYYSLPWQHGITGIVMNNAKWKELGFTDSDIPVTTEQLFDICDRIVAKNKGVSPFIYSGEDEYYTMISPIFFAQYEGNQSMNFFLNGRDPEGEVSEHIYTYQGQLEALKVMQELIATKGYQDSRSKGLNFSDMQGYFLNGSSVFCVNGSWLEIEMSNYEGADIGFMRMPVISTIVERATSLKTAATNAGTSVDEMLVKVIEEIDAGKTSSSYKGVTQEDFDIVKEARSMSYLSSGGSAVVCIPSYSKHVDLAKDFLKFMYSDEGLNIYYKTLKGAPLPLTPTTGYKSEGVTLSTFRKTINEALDDGFVFNYNSTAKIFVLGGVDKYFTNGTNSIVSNFTSSEPSTPEQIITVNRNYVKNNWSNIMRYL